MAKPIDIDGKYFASSDPAESFNLGPYDTVLDAIEDAERELSEHPKFWVGKLTQCKPSLDVDWLIDNHVDQIGEDFLECSEYYLDNVQPEQRALLEKKVNEVFIEWLKVTGNYPQFGNIDETKEYTNKNFAPEI